LTAAPVSLRWVDPGGEFGNLFEGNAHPVDSVHSIADLAHNGLPPLTILKNVATTSSPKEFARRLVAVISPFLSRVCQCQLAVAACVGSTDALASFGLELM